MSKCLPPDCKGFGVYAKDDVGEASIAAGRGGEAGVASRREAGSGTREHQWRDGEAPLRHHRGPVEQEGKEPRDPER